MSRMRAGRIYEKLQRYEDAIAVYQTVMQNHKNSRFGEMAALRIEVMRKKLQGLSETEPAENPAAEQK